MTYISKIAELLILPSILLILLGLLGVLISKNAPDLGRRLAIMCFSILLVCGLLPVGELLVRPLENTFERPGDELLSAMHGAIMLGGVIPTDVMSGRKVLSLNSAAERMVELDRLALRDPNLPLIISGGSGSLWHAAAEAPLIRDWLTSVGIPKRRILVEAESRNTWENANNSLVMLNEYMDLTVPRSLLIITSAAHMPRSIGSFRAAARELGFERLEFVAWPVDYRSSPVMVLRIQRLSDGLSDLDQAFREWFALTAYFFAGRTDDWFPQPVSAAAAQS